jgi:hypothetical protein
MDFLPGLALNSNLPDPRFLSSYDYRLEPPHPTFFFFLRQDSHYVTQAGLGVPRAGITGMSCPTQFIPPLF